MKNRYSAEVFWSEEDEAFVAKAPDLPGCCAVGKTRIAAIRELEPAIEAWLRAKRDVERPVSTLTGKPLKAEYKRLHPDKEPTGHD